MRKTVRFEGRVQGVGFRATTRHLAARLPLTGWVRNEFDGSVRMEVQGADGDIQTLLEALQAEFGRFIRTMEVTEVDDLDGEAAFRIAH
jgi:acylphosphatase